MPIKKNETDSKTAGKRKATVTWLTPLEVIDARLEDMARAIADVRALIQEELGDTDVDEASQEA